MSRKKAKYRAPSTAHPRGCQCRGSGFVSVNPVAHGNGATYDKVSIRCPGLQTSAPVLVAPPDRLAPAAAPPAPPTPPQPDLFDRKKAAAGDREDLT
jgi:hypothetical protein